MDTSKAKKTTSTKKEREYTKIDSFKIENVRVVDTMTGDLIFVNLTINGVTIYSCRVVNGSKGDFISFPQQKGKDGKYYNMVYVALSPEDEASILEAIQDAINGN